MYKYLFFNDYSEGAHPAVLETLGATNELQEDGYGNDSVSAKAAESIHRHIKNPQAAIHFISGGTQANLVVLASLLKPYESVVAANTAHIHVHEAGAIEATGHRINVVQTQDGKLRPDDIQKVLDAHPDEHMVKPKAVFIAQATEVGTVYSKGELEALSLFCKAHTLYLYLDGARLGNALCADGADCTLEDLSRLVDIFYIGGTKNGALLGEAIVIPNLALQQDFRYFMKQHGALLAKGRVLGAQFLALFSNDLYFDLARHANAIAQNLTEGLKAMGFSFLADAKTNQIFPIFPDSLIAKLKQDYGFYEWERIDDAHTAIRLVTSWATRDEAVQEFLADLKRYITY